MNSTTPTEETTATPVQKKSIRFRARSFLAFALAPEAPLEEWLKRLDSWTRELARLLCRPPGRARPEDARSRRPATITSWLA